MERFSGELRAHIPNPTVCDQIENRYDALIGLKRERIDVPTLLPELHKTGRMPFGPVKVLMLFQLAIRRAVELSDSMIRDANAFTYTPVWTSARSLFELRAVVMDTNERVSALMNEWDEKAHDEFLDHMYKVMLGFKSDTWRPKPPDGEPDVVVQAKNILTMIQRIDKKTPEFLAMYELLSEVAHPNYMGMMKQYLFNSEDMRTIVFVDTPLKRDSRAIVVPLDAAQRSLASLHSNISAYDQRFPDFAKIYEQNVKGESTSV